MKRLAQIIATIAIATLAVLLPSPARAQGYDPNLFAGLRWRLIGPFRGGRTVAAVGVPAQPNLFYIGVNNGGVWKTTDYGRIWTPIFDAESTGSIGAIAIAPSDPRTIYVGSGEGLQRPDLSVGDGIYKSTDGGTTWRHLGLRDGQQIPALIVDPRDPNRVFAAVLGHPYGPNEERGIFRSTDGGENWQKVLYKDENTGGMDLAFSPASAQTVFAVLWSARQAPWEAGWVLSKNNGLYKSADGGTTWRQITAGLPAAEEGLGRIGLATSASEPGRMYAILGAQQNKGGLYRSDDGGESWRLVNTDARLWGRDGDFNEVKVDPKNADVVYVANIVTWKSTDGGRTFVGWRGAPGGDDYHRLWINPDNPQIILNAADQGAVITVNGGETWSSWYNQPTAQMFHVTTDNRFPYWVYGGQQESGSAGVPSRGNDGQITFRDWRPVGLEEYGYAAPDPLHPNLVYGGKLTRFDFNTGEVKNVSPVPVRGPGDGNPVRFVRTAPVIFSPVDPHILYYAGNFLYKTLNGGESWTVISPDLTRSSYDVPANLGAFTSLDPEQGKHRGVIYTIAPSFRRLNLIWVGTDDGFIWVTHTGGRTWRNVTPPALTPWSKVSIMEASHFDTLAAYAAINRFRLDDVAPHIYRTKDGGKTWTEIVAGIPSNENVNVVREDPVRRGLLFAGTERSVYVSFDDGDHWQSLRQNLPPSSMRDLQVHENDLIVGTHGRSIWILDDLSPLRQLAAASRATGAFLFQPATAYRVRWNQNTDTPLPPDEPAGQNPPDGAVIDYHLPAAATGPVVLEIRDARGRMVRRFSSTDTVPADSGLNIPDYWQRPPQVVSIAAGTHRFVWDLHYAPPAAMSHSYPISAIEEDTWREPRGPVALPGRYEVRLSAGGRVLTQPLTIRMDPRVRVFPAALQQQFAAASRMAAAMGRSYDALQAVRALRGQIRALQAGVITGALADTVTALDRAIAAIDLTRVHSSAAGLLDLIDGVDAAPTTQAARAVTTLEGRLAQLLARWDAIRRRDVPRVNARLKAAGLMELR